MLGPELVRWLRVMSGGTPILVVAPFISPRSQELLAEQDISYLDLTGNVRLVLDNPGLFIQTSGAAQNPYAPQRPSRGLRGAKAGLMIRTLIDAHPPYSVLCQGSQMPPESCPVTCHAGDCFDVRDRSNQIGIRRRGRRFVEVKGIERARVTAQESGMSVCVGRSVH